LLYESLLGLHVVFGIKIDNYNLPPKFERRFTVTKYYDQQLKMDNIVNNTDNVENIDNVITVPYAVSSPFASSSVVRAEQEIVDTMNVDGTAGNIKSVRSQTLMFEVMFGIVSVVSKSMFIKLTVSNEMKLYLYSLSYCFLFIYTNRVLQRSLMRNTMK